MAKNSGTTKNSGVRSTKQATGERIYQGFVTTYTNIARVEADAITGRQNTPAVGRWLGDTPARVEKTLNAIIERATGIAKVSDIRSFEKYLQEEIGGLRFAINDRLSIMENNRDFVSGRAKRTADTAISELNQLNYRLGEFRRTMEYSKILQEMECWLIQNNRW